MAGPSLIPAGDYRTTYAADTTIFPTTTSRNAAIVGIVLICFAPLVFSEYWLSILIQIGIFAIAALGLNILVGFTGQISIGHAAFFLLGAFTSAYISNKLPIPVFFAIPLAGVITALVGLIFGMPAARCSAASSSGYLKTSRNISTANICTGAICTRSHRSTC